MTKSELMLYALAEARKMTNLRYRDAMSYGLKRAYNKQMTDLFIATHLAKSKTPKFMWLRGM